MSIQMICFWAVIIFFILIVLEAIRKYCKKEGYYDLFEELKGGKTKNGKNVRKKRTRTNRSEGSPATNQETSI